MAGQSVRGIKSALEMREEQQILMNVVLQLVKKEKKSQNVNLIFSKHAKILVLMMKKCYHMPVMVAKSVVIKSQLKNQQNGGYGY